MFILAERREAIVGKQTALEAKGELFKQSLFVENSLSFIFLSLMIRVLLSSWYKEVLFAGVGVGGYLLLLERKGGGSEHPYCTCCFYKVPLAQNNPYATGACSGETYSATLPREPRPLFCWDTWRVPQIRSLPVTQTPRPPSWLQT